MALTTGDRLGTYVILGEVGAGGMGQVYRARDERLGREVAIKVLPTDVAADPDRLQRFEVEARTAGGLNHPNLVTIYEFGAEGAVRFIVMELVEGDTLRQRLDTLGTAGSARSGRGSGSGGSGEKGTSRSSAAGQALSMRKATDYARQIALGLAAAHEKGIVHRDLKPENIVLVPDGRVKILDFGLAKVQTFASDGETSAPAGTTPGTVLGTIGYMAPEQVRGEAADHRSDLFALGAVLFEMLSGRRAFQGSSSVETMNAILTVDPPDLSADGSGVPPALAGIVQRCLEKSPAERYQSARDLAFHLGAAGSQTGSARGTAAPATAPRRRPVGLFIGLAAGLLAGIGLGWALLRQQPVEPVRFDVLTYSGLELFPAASPDGRLVAFSSNRRGVRQIWLKQLNGGGETPRTAGPADHSPRFSPDGNSLIFLREIDGGISLYKTAALGGEERRLLSNVVSADWSPDGSEIAFAGGLEAESGESVLGIMDASGGNRRTVTAFREWTPLSVRWSPDGRWLASRVAPRTGSSGNRIVLTPAAGGPPRELALVEQANPDSAPTWNGTGTTLLYSAEPPGATSTRILSHDVESGEVRTLFWALNATTGIEPLAPGVAVFDSVSTAQNLRVVRLGEAAGAASDPTWLTRGGSVDRQPTLSPDGTRVLFTSNRSGNRDLWELRRDDGSLRRLTDDAAADWDPAYTPDGKSVLWSSDRSGHFEIWIAGADGSGARQVSNDGFDAENPSMTPDGAWIVYASGNADKRGIWKVRPDGRDATQLGAGALTLPEVSPDGRYVTAVVAADPGRRIDVYRLADGAKMPFVITIDARFQLGDTNIGRHRWTPDGRSIAFYAPDHEQVFGIFAQDFDPDRDTSATRRRLAAFFRDARTESFGLLPDGSGLVVSGVEARSDILLARGLPGVTPASRPADGKD